jgi:hypothetical protein
MRARVAIFVAGLAFAAGGCTAFVAAELSGQQGSSDSDSGTPDSGPPLGDCFQLANNQCGQCIESHCEAPNASPPVSLEAVCQQAPNAGLVETVGNCADDPRFANFDCQSLFVDSGVYATSIDTPAAAENNLQKCINDNCIRYCSTCEIPVPTCGNDTIALAEAGACGTCLDNAMNKPSAPCQTWVLQQGCYEDPSNPIAMCAPPSGQCTAADCSGLQSPDPEDDDASAGLYTCLWQECQSSCPNP